MNAEVPAPDSALDSALDPGRSFSVAASAGSGKTHLLVSRIVRLLLAGVEPGGILALTFTRKAAAEMRARVDERLRQLAYADDEALDRALAALQLQADTTLCERARRLHEQASFEAFPLRAMTLHAFCQDVLTRFALEAKVPAGFELAENERELRSAALARLFNGIRRHPQGSAAHALQALLNEGMSDRELEKLLHGFFDQRSDWWAFTEFLAEFLSGGSSENPADDALEDSAEYGVEAATAQLAAQLDVTLDGEPCIALDAPAFSARLKFFHGALEQAGGVGTIKAEALEPALASSGAQRCDALAKALLTKDREPRAFKPKQSINPAQREHLSMLFGEVVAALQAVREQQLRQLTLRCNAAAYTLGAAALAALASELSRAGALAFPELEWRTYRLLREEQGSAWVRYKLDRRIAHLLLDEFQDTSPTQWRLLRPLIDEMSAGDDGRARSLFVVGDAKQSIYGFRRAAPELLAEAGRYVRERLGGATLPLNRSWRSASAIIEFLNRVFDGDAGAALGFEPHETHRSEDWGRVEVLPLIPRVESPAVPESASGLRDPLTTSYVEPEAQAAEHEGRLVAARIRALLNERLPVRNERGGARALECGDIMVLARNRTHLWAIEQALANAGIAFVGSTRGALLESIPARDLMALLRWLDAPHRNLDLAHVLRSPLFGVSDDDLVRLATTARTHRLGWWNGLRRIAAEAEISHALHRAEPLLANWLIAARLLPAHDLLDHIFMHGDVARRFEAALPQDSRVRAKLGTFLQLLLDADAGRYPTLGRLNTQLEALAAAGRDAPDEAPPPSSTRQVRVLTVHAAKGLEAPVVFLVNAAPVKRAAGSGWQVRWPADSAQPTQFLRVGKSGERDQVSQAAVDAQAQREAREDLNLLYVALSRSRQYLFVSAFAGGSKSWKWETSWHARCWNGLAPPDLPQMSADAQLAARELRIGEFPRIEDDSIHVAMDLLVDPSMDSSEESITGLFTDDPRLRIPLSAATRTPRRVRITDSAVGDPQAAARGTAIHWLLQRLAEQPDLNAAALHTEIEQRLERTVSTADFQTWLATAGAVLSAPSLTRFFDPAQFKRAWNEVAVHAQGQPSGVIDRLVDDGSTLWLVDYKTHPDPDAAALAKHYRPQLEAYAAMIRRAWPQQPLRAGLVLTASACWVEVLRIDV